MISLFSSSVPSFHFALKIWSFRQINCFSCCDCVSLGMGLRVFGRDKFSCFYCPNPIPDLVWLSWNPNWTGFGQRKLVWLAGVLRLKLNTNLISFCHLTLVKQFTVSCCLHISFITACPDFLTCVDWYFAGSNHKFQQMYLEPVLCRVCHVSFHLNTSRWILIGMQPEE